jgi:predicted Zn finger-like uncharacterized protein
MRLVCPSCSVAYEVPDSLVPAGRPVRCARCGGEWTPVATAEVPLEPEPEPEQEPPPPPREPAPRPPLTAMDRLAAHPAMSRPDRLLQAAWGVSLLVLVAAAGAGYVWRGDIMHAWPPSARMYAALGMHVP